MNNNNDNTEKLVRYLDGELNEIEIQALQTELDNDKALQQEMDNLLFTRSVIKNYGLTQKVNNIHQQMMQEMSSTKTPAKPFIKRLPKMTMRIAAAIIILVGLFGLYQYINVSPGNLYKDQYIPYQQATMRGTANTGLIEQGYNQKKYDAVVMLYNQKTSASLNEEFLTAQAYLNLNNYSNAIRLFNNIIQKNKVSGTKVLNDDAEYYLALTYLKNKQTAEALPLFKKIRSNKDHVYHSKISCWYLTRLKLLNWKN